MKKHFYLHFQDYLTFKEGEIITSYGSNQRARIIKVYRNTRWRRFLAWLGFKIHPNNTVKVISLKDENQLREI